MATKYIVNNVSGQTILNGIIISGGTSLLSTPPTSITGTTGNTTGQIAFDGDYLYYCADDFVAPEPITISGGGTTHVFNAEPGTDWNGYEGVYLQTGPPQEEGLTPLAGWYIVDDNGTIRQVLSDPAWFTNGDPTPYPNGTGWFFVLDGLFTYSTNNPTITFYETLPTVSGGAGSGNIWRTTKLDKTLNTTGVYRALLTQTGELEVPDISFLNYALIIGETYTIINYVEDADFSNIANVQSGTINQTGCIFIATGTTPNSWNDGTRLVSNGGLIVDVLENTLGYDINWSLAPFGGYGYYIGINDTTGPLINSFPKNKVSITTQNTLSFVTDSFDITTYSKTVDVEYGNDSAIQITVFDYFLDDVRNNSLYYTPIEIKINQDLDTTPILVYGENRNSFPYGNVSVDLLAGSNYVASYYNSSYTLVNDITELVTKLNSDPNTSVLGTYSVNEEVEGGIILTMATNLKNQFSPNNTLTFEVFND